MKIMLELPDGTICAFINGVKYTLGSLQMVSYSLGTDDLRDGNTIKLPREGKE